ncbi:MAG TPA: hypothetical protein PK078_11195 [Anaerolineales bacterium]|nr:hypothetical protein [Anaerolineales bacterium]HNA90187.1 hypothetical protein [Anaerolineales bacterium]HNB36344.1 hypothetical protein [Anaerolineales bacterium]HNC09674.1 hypothetical protein [Anaerolineales bacterium]
MKKLSALLPALLILFSACNIPATSSQPDTSIATAAALTVESALNEITPLPSPETEQLVSPTVEQVQATTEVTPTYSQPLASFEDVTNCRTGPGVDYEKVTQIQPGFAVELIGFYPPNYWIVSTDKGPCWVAGEFVTPSGSYAAVPTVTLPPTATGEPPQNVSLQKWDIACDFAANEAEVVIRWGDQDGESGYRVVRNDEIIAELPADTTEFKEKVNLVSGQGMAYYIIAYNALGSSQSKTITLSC